MTKRKSKRELKRSLRSREKELNTALLNFLADYDFSLAFDAEDRIETEATEKQFRLLLKLRWLVYDFLWIRLKLHPAWRNKQWFLELFDVDEIRIENEHVILKGDIVWWAQGQDAIGQWWPADHEAHSDGFYKIKLRGDMKNGYWLVEPMSAILKPAKNAKRVATYQVEFGFGSTYLKVKNTR